MPNQGFVSNGLSQGDNISAPLQQSFPSENKASANSVEGSNRTLDNNFEFNSNLSRTHLSAMTQIGPHTSQPNSDSFSASSSAVTSNVTQMPLKDSAQINSSSNEINFTTNSVNAVPSSSSMILPGASVSYHSPMQATSPAITPVSSMMPSNFSTSSSPLISAPGPHNTTSPPAFSPVGPSFPHSMPVTGNRPNSPSLPSSSSPMIPTHPPTAPRLNFSAVSPSSQLPPTSMLPQSGTMPLQPPRPGMLYRSSPSLGVRPPMPPHSPNSPLIPPTAGGPQYSTPVMQQRPGAPMPPPPGSALGTQQQGMIPSNSQITSQSSPLMPPPQSISHNTMGSPVNAMTPQGPGIPPMPHPQSIQSPMGGRYPAAGPMNLSGGGYAQPQGRRLNPDDMPSPLQVMEDDREKRSGEFLTVMKGALPPLVTTDYYVKDGGIASPRFIRSTMYNVPATPDMMKQASIPFGLVISPFAELHSNEAPLYCGTSLANGPVRCNRCKAYMSPLMVFMNGGRR